MVQPVSKGLQPQPRHCRCHDVRQVSRKYAVAHMRRVRAKSWDKYLLVLVHMQNGVRLDALADTATTHCRAERRAVGDAAGRAEHMPCGTLGGADSDVGSMFPEDPLDCQRFADVTLRCACAVGVDIVNILRIKPGISQGHAHAASGSFAFR